MKTSELIDEKLDWAVSYALSHNPKKDFHSHGMTWNGWWETATYIDTKPNEYRRLPKYSTDWSQGGPIIERENITLIRANSQYIEGKCVPLWFAETDKWVGHNITTGYEGEYFDPCFMIDEAGGCYGPTPLIAAMRCYVASKLGGEVDIPKELLGEQ